MSQKRVDLWAGARAVIAAIIGSATIATPAGAGYWTVPVDYYGLEHIRFTLNSPRDGISAAMLNMSRRLPYPEFGAEAFQVFSVDDPDRGPVTRFEAEHASHALYRMPERQDAGNASAASLSVWIRPRSPSDMVLLSRGTELSGFTLYRHEGKLVFTYWNDLGGGADWRHVITSQNTVADNVWHNIVITQERDGAGDGGYVALYVDGVLAARSTKSPAGSGLLGQNFGVASEAVVGGASTSGWVMHIGQWVKYRRGLTATGDIVGMTPTANAEMVDFRYFGGQGFVCSDKTGANYKAANRGIVAGTRCHLASDVTSFVQDRLEQASMLARLPLALELSDHNFSGLNTPNRPIPCSGCMPVFVADELRQSVARFNAKPVQYFDVPGPLSVTNLSGPYSVAFWVRNDQPVSGVAPLYTAGSATGAGIDIAMEANRIQAVAWPGPGAVTAIRSNALNPGWNHVAVSHDGAPESGQGLATSGFELYINGALVDRRDADYLEGDRSDPVGLGGPGFSTRGPTGATINVASFKGAISEVQVFKAPISAPQARTLASRFPNAYTPRYDKVAYSHVTTDIAPKQVGYAYADINATTTSPWSAPGYTYDSLHLTFTMDWSTPNPRWADENTGLASRDCQFVLGGVENYAPSGYPAAASASVLLCFSPDKIAAREAPFSLALRYPQYGGKVLYLPIIEDMAPASVLQRLKTYSPTVGVAGLQTDFNLNIGRYNTLLQATTRQQGVNAPNYISPVYQGADNLISNAFTPGSAGRFVTTVRPLATQRIDLRYVDQKQLMDDMDIKFSKDR